MPTRTRFLFLLHPKEFKQEKAATGRLTHLCLANSELHAGIAFDQHETVQEILSHPGFYPVLLYPGRDAVNLSTDRASTRFAGLREAAVSRTLLVVVLDGTWALARKMLRCSPSLQRLPRIMFTASTPSRYVIKQQPAEGCLSTLEAVHELLRVLQDAGLDSYPLPDQLLGLFERMQKFQIACATDPTRTGYRRSVYRPPAERKPGGGRNAYQLTRMFHASSGDGTAVDPTEAAR